MRINKIFALGTVISLALCGCGSNGADVIINAEGYEGIVLMTEKIVAAPVPIPDVPVFTVPPDNSQTGETGTGDTSDIADVTENTENTDESIPVHTEPPATAAPEPKWTETAASGIMYVNKDGIYSVVEGLIGSIKVDRYSLNQAVEIIAKTNTDYYKISDGHYIHADFLSTEMVLVQTEETTPEPVETDPPETTPEETEPPVTSPTVTEPADPNEPPEENLTPIMGSSVLTVEQMRRFIRKMNPEVAESVIEMIPYYLSEGQAEGVRGDIAFAQSCLETGYFKFEKTGTGSVVTIDQNNFCGLGVTSLGVKGESFATPQLGIRAQIQHLKAYASTLPLNGERVDNRFFYVVRGCAPYVEWLGMQENPSGRGWAGGKNYGPMIMDIYKNILSS